MSMVCSTPCVGVGVSVSDLMIDGYLASSFLTWCGIVLLTSCSWGAACVSAAVLRGCCLTSLVERGCLTSRAGAAGAVAAAACLGGVSLLTSCSCGAACGSAVALRGRCLTSLVERCCLTSRAGAVGAVAAAAALGGVSLLTS